MENASSNTSPQPKRRFLKLAAILSAILILIITSFYFGLFSPYFWQAVKQEKVAKEIIKELEAQRRREAEDPYGGKTPQEVYELFVKALEKQDIDLAVKYFTSEKQEEIHNFLSRVQNSNNWQRLIDDLSGKTAKTIYEKAYGDRYEILVVTNDNKEDLIVALRAEKNPNSNLWKLTEFW